MSVVIIGGNERMEQQYKEISVSAIAARRRYLPGCQGT